MNYKNLCYRCFSSKPIADRPCPFCGYINGTDLDPTGKCLRPGTVLNRRYIVGEPIGIGGFGITYKCIDQNKGGICAVKEYFPSNIAGRRSGTTSIAVQNGNVARYNRIMSRFVAEADLLKQFRHKNIVAIYDTFFENGTAYYAMEYCDGTDLRRYTANFTRRIQQEEAVNLISQVMNGLEYIHGKGILHRDIAPDNIYVTRNGVVKILDFGAARREMDQTDRSLSVIVKAGYAPIEQYGGSERQGPFTDIYALGATFYHVLTGRAPVESTKLAAGDQMVPFSALRPDLSAPLRYLIEHSMELKSSRRFQTVREMKAVLGVPQQLLSEERAPGTMEKAGRGLRIGAYVLDLLIWGSLALGASTLAPEGTGVLAVAVALFIVIFMMGDMICELAFNASPGKAILGLRVKNKQGFVPDTEQIALRNVIKLLGVFLVFGGGEDTLDDRLTNTTVFKAR